LVLVSGVDDQDSEDVGEKPHKRKKTDGNKIPARVWIRVIIIVR